MAHLPTLPTSLVQQALEEHLGILSDAYAVKETVKRSYIIKCIEDIKKVRQTDAQYCLDVGASLYCSLMFYQVILGSAVSCLHNYHSHCSLFNMFKGNTTFSPHIFLPAVTVLF